jgi:hypothetical protein
MDSTVNALANGSAPRLIGLQPPLSPPSAVSAVPVAPAPAAAPAPVATAPPPPAPSTENLLVRFGLLTTEQVEEAIQDQRASGKHVAQIAVERGWVTREQLAQLVAQPAAPPAPEPAPPVEPAAAVEPAPAPEPEPVLEVAPEPQVEPAQPEPALATVARVYARLTTGERVEIASFAELAQARERAAEVVRELTATQPEWPFFSGRFVRPEAIVTVDVEATLG